MKSVRPTGWSGPEHLPSEERSQEWGLVSLKQGGLQGAPQQLPGLWGGDGEEGTRLFTEVHGARMGHNGQKLKQKRLRLDVRRTFFPTRTVEQWKRLPSEIVPSPSSEVFKLQLGQALSNVV